MVKLNNAAVDFNGLRSMVEKCVNNDDVRKGGKAEMADVYERGEKNVQRLVDGSHKCLRWSRTFRIILPFKDQRSADVVRRQLSDLGKKINSDLRPVFTSKKIADDINVAEAKPPLINQQCVVYKFKCDSCDADYVGYTRRHLFQRIDEHKHSAIGNHLRDAHNQSNKDLNKQFTILKNTIQYNSHCIVVSTEVRKSPLSVLVKLPVQLHKWSFEEERAVVEFVGLASMDLKNGISRNTEWPAFRSDHHF
ncbi:hypothetical protein ACROYT_G014635 [Oculina patagonica]